MSIDYRTLLDRAVTFSVYDNDEVGLAILATRISDLCPDCTGQKCGRCGQWKVIHNFDGPGDYDCGPCDHPNAPTIADLLRWGENVARGDSALTLLHAMDGTPVPDKYEMTGRDLEVLANACLATLRTEADR